MLHCIFLFLWVILPLFIRLIYPVNIYQDDTFFSAVSGQQSAVAVVASTPCSSPPWSDPCAAASRTTSTGASSAISTTPSRPSSASPLPLASKPTWTSFPPSCWPSLPRRCSRKACLPVAQAAGEEKVDCVLCCQRLEFRSPKLVEELMISQIQASSRRDQFLILIFALLITYVVHHLDYRFGRYPSILPTAYHSHTILNIPDRDQRNR